MKCLLILKIHIIGLLQCCLWNYFG